MGVSFKKKSVLRRVRVVIALLSFVDAIFNWMSLRVGRSIFSDSLTQYNNRSIFTVEFKDLDSTYEP